MFGANSLSKRYGQINNKQYQLAGRVAMDMTAVLVDETVKIGDKVECWGENLAIEIICKIADTIPHQLLTTVTERVIKNVGKRKA